MHEEGQLKVPILMASMALLGAIILKQSSWRPWATEPESPAASDIDSDGEAGFSAGEDDEVERQERESQIASLREEVRKLRSSPATPQNSGDITPSDFAPQVEAMMESTEAMWT